MQKSERKQVRKAIAMIHSGRDYETGMRLLCGLANLGAPEEAITAEQANHRQTDPAKFRTRGKWCECGHGVGAHRDSGGANATFCRRCNCVRYVEREVKGGDSCPSAL